MSLFSSASASLAAVCAALLPAASGHFVFLSRDPSAGKVYAAFGETGQPGEAFLLPMVAPMIHPWSVSASGNVTISMTTKETGGGNAELEGPFTPASTSFSLAMSFTYGVYGHGDNPKELLKYYSHASSAGSTRDWQQVEVWGYTDFSLVIVPSTAGLSSCQALAQHYGMSANQARLKDYFSAKGAMLSQASARRASSAGVRCTGSTTMCDGAQCCPGNALSGGQTFPCPNAPSSFTNCERATTPSPLTSAATCVDAIVKYRGQPVSGTVEFFGDGASLGKIQVSATGRASARVSVPADGKLFASVNYRVNTAGSYGGQSYDFEDHWATSFTLLSSGTGLLQAVDKHDHEREQVDVGSFIQTGVKASSAEL